MRVDSEAVYQSQIYRSFLFLADCMAATEQDNLTSINANSAVAVGRKGFWLAFGLAALVPLALPFDLPVAQYLAVHRLPGDLYRWVMLSEAFGFGITAIVILIIAWVLDPAQRKPWRWAMLATIMAGMMANLAKLCMARVRPHSVKKLLNQELLNISSVNETFLQWFPPFGSESGMQSFPSAHAATAAGLAVALSWLYPRGRWVFGVLAGMACLQRMVAEAHYLSDVLAGAALGTFVATVVLKFAEARRSM